MIFGSFITVILWCLGYTVGYNDRLIEEEIEWDFNEDDKLKKVSNAKL